MFVLWESKGLDWLSGRIRERCLKGCDKARRRWINPDY